MHFVTTLLAFTFRNTRQAQVVFIDANNSALFDITKGKAEISEQYLIFVKCLRNIKITLKLNQISIYP